MIIVSSFETIRNSVSGIFSIAPAGQRPCPLCGGALAYRDSRLRRLKNLYGEKSLFLLRRLLCGVCGKLHTEIPNTIQPYKHYDSEAIQTVLDGSAEAAACAADDSTIRRWKGSFAEAEDDIGQRPASVCAREADERAPIGAGALILARVRTAARWLAFVMELLINGGHKIRARFAFCPPPSPGKIKSSPEKRGKEAEKNDKTTENG
jgi:predicted RNA-binding Zn-ribbon protein involved in translation (DUF1610 family)